MILRGHPASAGPFAIVGSVTLVVWLITRFGPGQAWTNVI
jgi:hypothetical protein